MAFRIGPGIWCIPFRVGSTHPLGVLPPHTALAGLPLIPPGTTDGTSTFVSVTGITPTTSVTPATVSSSALLSNLLPLANASLTPSVGAYVGEGVPPVPPKLVTRIHRLDFVEMGELLPEFWVESNREVDPDRRPRRSRKVTDIFTWLQCFGSFTAVLATHNPGMIPELMAYMGTIVRVSQDFAGLAWVRYDEAFRRQAALTGNTKWSVINSTLYTLCFTSTAPSGNRRCELCLASSHTEADCALRGDPDPDIKSRLKNLESAVLSFSKSAKAQPPLPPMSGPPNPSGEVCRKWNAAGCSYPRCRHLHVCATCGDNGHPASRCSVGRRPPPAMAHRTGGVGRPSAPY